MEEYLAKNMLTVYSAGFINMDKQFLTIGVNGIVEAAEFLGLSPTNNEEYKDFLRNTLKIFYSKNKEAKKLYGYKFNTEFVPAENLGVKNAKWDRQDGYFVAGDTIDIRWDINSTTATTNDVVFYIGKKG